jgi:hypothetical protein
MKPNPVNPRAVRAGLFGLAGALFLANAVLADDAAPASSAGTWQPHKYSFLFMGFTSTYSCDGLADKLKKLLLAAGAADVKAEPGACASGFGRPDKFARADLKFSTLAPLDGTASAGAASAGTAASGAPSPGARPVSGAWRSVTFARNSPRDLQLGDCELIEQFKQQVLPMFTTRNVVSDTTCVPHQESGSNIALTFDSFAAASPPPRTAAR